MSSTNQTIEVWYIAVPIGLAVVVVCLGLAAACMRLTAPARKKTAINGSLKVDGDFGHANAVAVVPPPPQPESHNHRDSGSLFPAHYYPRGFIEGTAASALNN